LERIRKGKSDLRKLPKPMGPGGLSQCLRTPGQSALSFLWALYHSSAEGMPNKMKFAFQDNTTQETHTQRIAELT
jgi:hypothetical protein